MKVHFQRLISLFLTMVLCLGLFVLPVSAAEDQPVTSTGTFWSSLADKADHWYYGLWGKEAATVIGAVCGSVCSVSDDKLHRGKVIRRSDTPGQWVAQCSLCSDEFTVYDDDMQNAYNSHVGDIQTELGTIQVGSNGYWVLLRFSDATGSLYLSVLSL